VLTYMIWEERWHPLREEWVIVAAHRQDRPWSGETIKYESTMRPPYVEDCYLCPGNRRVSGKINPEYTGVFVFDNDHPCVGMNAPNFVFKTIETEAKASEHYSSDTRRILFQDIIAAEQSEGKRIVCENETAIAFLPYFARYAYEVFVAPKRTHPSIASLSDAEARDLAEVLKETLVRFDNLWQMPFPYVMPLHQAPTDGGDYRNFH